MTKEKFIKLIRFIESEDYYDFSCNFTTIESRVEYLYDKYVKTTEELRTIRDTTKRRYQIIPTADRKILAERHLVGKESLRKLAKEYGVAHEAIRYAIRKL